ncbi:hypothetical protein Q2T40_01110 [Winogradskyella maritima]|nr:hypothetical protein [Winogradskyella maritima]
MGLGIFSIVDIFYEPSSGGGGGGGSFLGPQLKTYLFIAIGLALAGKGIYQFIKAYKGDFLQKFEIGSISIVRKEGPLRLLATADSFHEVSSRASFPIFS